MVNNAPSAIVFKKQMKSQICLFIIAVFQTVRSFTIPKIAGTGQECNEGFDGIICEPGLTCVVPKTDPIVPNAPGLCFVVVGAGETCGGNSLTAPRCNTGLECVKSSNGSETDSGVCKEEDTS